MHQPNSSTIRLDQHSDHANHTLIIHPQLAGFWGLSKFKFRSLLHHYCLEFDQSLRTSSIFKYFLPTKKGKVQFLGLIQQCLNFGSSLTISVIRWLHRHLSTTRWPHKAPWAAFPSSCTQLHFRHRQSQVWFWDRSLPREFLMAPSKFMSV